MTIDEGIKHLEEMADFLEYGVSKNDMSAPEHRQLAEWLKELQEYRAILDELKDEITRAFDDLTESEKYGEDDSYTEYNRGCVWGLLHSYEMFGREYEEVNANDE